MLHELQRRTATYAILCAFALTGCAKEADPVDAPTGIRLRPANMLQCGINQWNVVITDLGEDGVQGGTGVDADTEISNVDVGPQGYGDITVLDLQPGDEDGDFGNDTDAVDTADWAEPAGFWEYADSFTAVPPGTYMVTVTAEDALGNTLPAPPLNGNPQYRFPVNVTAGNTEELTLIYTCPGTATGAIDTFIVVDQGNDILNFQVEKVNGICEDLTATMTMGGLPGETVEVLWEVYGPRDDSLDIGPQWTNPIDTIGWTPYTFGASGMQDAVLNYAFDEPGTYDIRVTVKSAGGQLTVFHWMAHALPYPLGMCSYAPDPATSYSWSGQANLDEFGSEAVGLSLNATTITMDASDNLVLNLLPDAGGYIGVGSYLDPVTKGNYDYLARAFAPQGQAVSYNHTFLFDDATESYNQEGNLAYVLIDHAGQEYSGGYLAGTRMAEDAVTAAGYSWEIPAQGWQFKRPRILSEFGGNLTATSMASAPAATPLGIISCEDVPVTLDRACVKGLDLPPCSILCGPDWLPPEPPPVPPSED